MKEVTKGVVITLIGALICREFYAKGYNNALKKIDQLADFREAVIKETMKES